MPRNPRSIELQSKEFGVLFTEHRQRIGGRRLVGGLLAEDLNYYTGPTFEAHLRRYEEGTLFYCTGNSSAIAAYDGAVQLANVLHALDVSEDSKMLAIATRLFGDAFKYPPKEAYSPLRRRSGLEGDASRPNRTGLLRKILRLNGEQLGALEIEVDRLLE